MPFNNNSLDDLFRSKDKELPTDTHRVDAHWEQMQHMLSPAATKPSKYNWLKITGALVILTAAALFFTLGGKKQQQAGQQPVAANTLQQDMHTSSPVANTNNENKKPEIQAAVVQPTTEQKKPGAPKPAPGADRITANATPGQPVKGTEYIELPQEPQVFHFNASMDTSIMCVNGTTIRIPAKSLADANGNTVTGEVTMIVQEYYRYEDVIAAGLNRNAEMKKKSITAGMVKFDAYRDEQKLDVKPGCSIEIRMRKDLLNVKPGKNTVNNAAPVEADKMQDLNIHNLGWIGYEKFYNDTRPVTDIRIQIPKNVDVNQLISQLAFISVQGVMPGYIENNQVVFYNIPIGEKAWFISLGTTGKKFLSCVEQIEIKGNDVVTPDYRETSPEQFKRQLEMLTALPVKEQ